MVERVQERAAKMPNLRDINYQLYLKESGLTTLGTRRLKGEEKAVSKTLNGYENIDITIFS